MTKDRTKGAGKRTRLRRLRFIQDALPVRDIRAGIVELADGACVRILEVEPINFQLRSDDEQYNVIASFASWLKISPVRIQMKSLTRRADSNRHAAGIRADLEKEESEACRRLGEGYIRMVRDVGSREALTRRFFLIFRHEPLRREKEDFRTILSHMKAAEEKIVSCLMQCGNRIVRYADESEEVLELLYMFLNPISSRTESLEERVRRVVTDEMLARGECIGRDDPPRPDIGSMTGPRGLDFSHASYIITDGIYRSYLYVRADGYPTLVRGGWLSNIVNAGEGIDVDLFLRREDRGRTVDRVAQKIRLNRTKIKDTQDTSSDYEELENAIRAGYYIKSGIANHNEDLFYMSILISVSAVTREELFFRVGRMKDILKAMDIHVAEMRYGQEEAFFASLPLLIPSPRLEKKGSRNVLTSGAAACYPFTSFELSDDGGVLLGVNRHNNSLCIVDLFDTKKNKNANLNILGTSGAGKTFTLQLLALRMRMRGVQCFILAPIKGHEFRRACTRIGGEFIRIAPGSPHCINVMEIRHTVTPEMELIDGMTDADFDSALSRKIQQLMIFFSLLIPDMTNEEEQMLDEALVRTYAGCGITHDNASLYEDAKANPPVMKKMPILGDLHKELESNPLTARIAVIVARFVTGSARSFNRETNVNLDNKYIVIDLSELKGRMLPVGMMIALDFVWDKTKSDRTKRKAIFIDEIWQLIGAGSSRLAAEFCLEIFKVIRGYGGAAVAATQDLSDFFSLDDGRYGRAIINVSKNKIILNLEQDEARFVEETIGLTRTEVRSILAFERGEALVCSNNTKVPVMIRASEEETEMITTDRGELESIMRRRLRERRGDACTHD